MASPPPAPAAVLPLVLLVRHGETAWNRDARMQGHTDVSLAPEGVRQADALARRLSHAGLARIVSSDLSRAVATARAVADATGLAVEQDARLREQHLGTWEGSTFAEVAARDPDLAARFRALDPDARPPGGESRGEAADRAWGALVAVASPGSPSPVLVVTHGGPLQFVVYRVLGLPLASPRRFLLPNVGLTVLAPKDDGWVLRTLSDTAHVEGIGSERFPF